MGACVCCKKKRERGEEGHFSFDSAGNIRLTVSIRNRQIRLREEIMAANKTHLVHHVVDKVDFDNQLKEAGSKLVIVDFFATWCGPCKTISPKVEELAETMTDVIFLKVDVDQIEELASLYEISCMPTFLAFIEGSKVGETSGANIEKLKNFIDEKNKK